MSWRSPEVAEFLSDIAEAEDVLKEDRSCMQLISNTEAAGPDWVCRAKLPVIEIIQTLWPQKQLSGSTLAVPHYLLISA